MVENGISIIGITLEKVVVCSEDHSIYEEFIGENAMTDALHRYEQLVKLCFWRG